MDMGVAKYQLEQRGNKFTMLDETVSSEQYGIGFKLGNTALRDEVQTSLNDMLADGTFDEIAEKAGRETGKGDPQHLGKGRKLPECPFQRAHKGNFDYSVYDIRPTGFVL